MKVCPKCGSRKVTINYDAPIGGSTFRIDENSGEEVVIYRERCADCGRPYLPEMIGSTHDSQE